MKIVLEKGQRLFFTSDTHYGHSNICSATTNWTGAENMTRKFSSLDKMNDELVFWINQRVGENDILFHLGDWSFGGFENIEEFYNRLICKNIHLILGNHDHHIDRNRGDIQKLFLSVSWFGQFEYMGETIECCHYPISSWNALRKGRIHLHGHCHLPHNQKISNGRRMDVGMDGNPDFEPYDLHEVIKMLKKKEIGSEMGPLDHHTDDLQNIDT